jgi:uncharacterized protein YjiS (DUF1127 family)
MSNKLTFLGRIRHALERSAERRAREYLLGLSDRHLDDMGLSRQRIKQGPSAWPWRKAEDPLPVPGLSGAMRELNTPNGTEAANLGSGGRSQPDFAKHDPETKLAA